MSFSGSASGGAFKRKREREVEEDQPALQVTAYAEPLTLLAMVKSHHDMLVCMQLCNQQGVGLFSFVRLSPRVSCPFTGAPVYGMSLTHSERLRAVGCGLKGKLVRLVSLGVGRHFEQQRNWDACRKMMQMHARRMASKLMAAFAAVRDKAAKEAEELCASGRCAAALVPLQGAIKNGDLPSRALKAWLLIQGREGVAKDEKRAFELAEGGASFGCHHCQGVLAYCFLYGCGCGIDHERSLELARKSSGNGSKYGQITLGELHQLGEGGLERDVTQVVAFYRLAAAQGLDVAWDGLGNMHYFGLYPCVARDFNEALRWYHLAAAQGHAQALYCVARCHLNGHGVLKSIAAAIHWYSRAQAAGSAAAAVQLQRLGA